MIERVEQVLQRINEIENSFNRQPVFKNVQSFEKTLAESEQAQNKSDVNNVSPQIQPTVENKTVESAEKSSNTKLGGAPDDIAAIIEDSAARYGVDVNLVNAIAKNESAYRTDAVSEAGAVGIMQLMPSTAAGLGVKDIYNPYDNIDGGTRYLRELLDTFDGDITSAVAAYNAGPQAVRAYGGVPPYSETQNYVNNVLADYK